MKKRPTPPKGKPSAEAGRKDTAPENQGDLFGAIPEPLRTLPPAGTQPRRVLALLAEGERPDHADWYHETGSWRLAAHVGRLVHEFGWPVQSTEVLAPSRACPGRTIARYWLKQDDVQRARVALRWEGQP
ncbi:hypothetical protein [Sphaerotilus uruguayifluvii]|uniref:Uncharacterized protein n=1 Tax=Sphaerotilus uruguayifluvii TaxID=2735897 RepID=A0ABX2G297_9BURK|nr:hypothetical protein [Leptothrix sp. C29]NRT55896.1 hypothetical protein [Leptothrix sp. C29]